MCGNRKSSFKFRIYRAILIISYKGVAVDGAEKGPAWSARRIKIIIITAIIIKSTMYGAFH